jgi:hypothetical protein
MSVHHEALKSGRINRDDVARYGGVDRALRIVKRFEAEDRNAATPHARRRYVRRAAVSDAR